MIIPPSPYEPKLDIRRGAEATLATLQESHTFTCMKSRQIPKIQSGVPIISATGRKLSPPGSAAIEELCLSAKLGVAIHVAHLNYASEELLWSCRNSFLCVSVSQLNAIGLVGAFRIACWFCGASRTPLPRCGWNWVPFDAEAQVHDFTTTARYRARLFALPLFKQRDYVEPRQQLSGQWSNGFQL